ncbi:MAG: helicase-associated domain-containing protein, partial [Marmoricola sp.]
MSQSSPAETASSAPRTVAEVLRGWSAEQLAALLEARPDLAVPAPTDSAQLAARTATRSSVVRALELLDRQHLAVLEAVASETGATPERIDTLVAADDVAAVLGRLQDLLLVWDDGRGLRALTVVRDLVGVPAGPAAGGVPVLLQQLDEPSRRLLDHLDHTGADGRTDAMPARPTVRAATTPTEHLLARGLLVARDAHHVTIPWSVRLHLRDGRSTRDRVDRPPELLTTSQDPALVDRLAAGTAFEALRRVEVLLDRWGSNPPGALRSGGLGVRDLKAIAELWHVDLTEAGLLVETMAAAGLLAMGTTAEHDQAWLPTDGYDAWLSMEPADRWVRLVLAWLDNPRRIGLAGGREAGKPVNALSPGLERGWLPALRRDVLAELALADPGEALAPETGEASLLERLRWLRPRRPAGRDAAVAEALREAAVLGLTGRDALAAPGRAVLEGDNAAAVLAELLPEPVDHVLVQADLTAVAPGPLEPELARDLGLVADVESRGGATVYRFTGDSVRRAFDAGWSASEVHAFITSASRTPVPQALDYLVDDVSRRFGVLRAGRADSFLRSDDETALTALLHEPGAATLRLRRIAPTVLVSDVPLETLLPRVRDLGLAPVVEAPDGTVRVAHAEKLRARMPRRRGGSPAGARA